MAHRVAYLTHTEPFSDQNDVLFRQVSDLSRRLNELEGDKQAQNQRRKSWWLTQGVSVTWTHKEIVLVRQIQYTRKIAGGRSPEL